MIAPYEIERFIKARSFGRDIGVITSAKSYPILHLGPDGRGTTGGQVFETFRLEFSSGLVAGGVICPETGHFALWNPTDDALSVAIARAEELRDPGTEVAVFEAADYAAVGALYLSGDSPFAVTVKPEAREAVPVAQVVSQAYSLPRTDR